MTRKKAFKRWETKIGNAEITPQAVWSIAKSLHKKDGPRATTATHGASGLHKKDGPRAPTATHGASGFQFHPTEKANAIADCLEIQFSPHDLCDENHERRVEAAVRALHETVDREIFHRR
jgi:hypothetical protein